MAASPPESRAEMATRLKEKPFYKATLESIDPNARKILEEYAGIPPAEVLSHVQAVRDQAWEVFPYPCMGLFTFVKMHISKNPAYGTVLKRLLANDNKKDKATLVDLGCGFGQELRTLVAAGVAPTSLYGVDVSDGFVELGLELFRDKATMQSRFIVTDLLNSPSVPAQLQGKVNFVFAGSFFHLFGWDDQLALSKRAVEMLKPEAGSMIFGHQLGCVEAREDAAPDVPSGKIYFHDPESFRRFWRIVGEETGTKWEVQVESGERGIDEMRKLKPTLIYLRFAVERL
jgi:SAM-dependent methyltransferase